MEQRSSVQSLLQVLRKTTVIMHGNMLLATVKMVVLRFKVLILISPTVPWHMLTPSESTLILRICIELLTEFWMPVMNYKMQIPPFMTEYVSVHHPIRWTGLKNIIPMSLLIEMKVYFGHNT